MIELFARKTAPGWDSWGDEVESGECADSGTELYGGKI